MDDLLDMAGVGDPIESVASPISDGVEIDPQLLDLHNASSLEAIASCYEGTDFGEILKTMAEGLAGTNLPGMEIIKASVDDVCSFYHIDPIKISFDPTGPGAYWGGLTTSTADDWICGNPFELNDLALEYATPGFEQDYINAVFAHEMGHFWVDHLGVETEIPHIANEAVSDFLAGIYVGARGLDPDGFSRFLASLPEEGQFSDDGERIYPGGLERARLFEEGYAVAKDYTWNEFQTIVDDQRFNLRDTVMQIAKRYM